MPMTVSFGSAVAEFGNGNADGSSTRTIVMLCWTLDRIGIGDLDRISVRQAADVGVEARLSPTVTAVPAVVVSESALDICAAISSIWLCAWTRTLSRMLR